MLWHILLSGHYARFLQAGPAHIHDIGYGDYARKSAAGLQQILTDNDIRDSLIVDLGCGSGISAQEFNRMGYRVLGIGYFKCDGYAG